MPELHKRTMLLAAAALPLAATAQPTDTRNGNIVVEGHNAGPELKGVISRRDGNRIRIAAEDGTGATVTVTEATRIRFGGGLFGTSRDRLPPDTLMNGLPVTVRTLLGPGGELVASRISFRNGDFRTATMIRNGTSQRFDEQTAATDSLRGRIGDIDKYNVKSTTTVHFETGKADLSARDKANLCSTATTADKTENALLLVVGYTDAVGDQDYNQQLSEKRAAHVINYLQQACGWKPYRMLTPTGMAKADPVASNATAEGKAQNRRVAVNIMVSKSVDGL